MLSTSQRGTILAKQKLARALSRDTTPDRSSKKTLTPQSEKSIVKIIKPIMVIFKLFVRRKISQVPLFYAMQI
jgi:hypothetical protein